MRERGTGIRYRLTVIELPQYSNDLDLHACYIVVRLSTKEETREVNAM